MPRKTPPFITRIQAEGTTTEKLAERRDILSRAKRLAVEMPTFGPERQIYVSNLLRQAMRGTLNQEVFKEFVHITNSYLEVEQVSPRVKLIEKRRQR